MSFLHGNRAFANNLFSKYARQVRKIDLNDARDLIWLSVALPYSNLNVLEKYWSHMVVRSCGIDTKYRTTIIADTREIPTRLAEMGC